MSLAVDQIIPALRDHAQQLGVFETVQGHEAKVSPGTGVHCEIFGGGFGLVPSKSGLDSVSLRLTFRIRLRTSWLQQPADDVDSRLLKCLDPLMASYIAGFTLGGLVESLDILGAGGGGSVQGQFGYLDQGDGKYRTVEFQLPLLVDDLWTEAA